MKFLRVLAIFVLCLFTSIGYAQSELIFQDSLTGLPIESIVIQQFESATFERTINVQVANEDGEVALNLSNKQDTLFFTSSHLQYNTRMWSIAVAECNPCILKVRSEKFQLPDINVRAIDQGVRVINDTIRFDLNVFKNKSQQDLEDLLKDLPGIEIREGGDILYNNKKIDKILLSGKDVINSQFDLANRLVRKDIVETIQIVPGEKKADEDSPPQYLDIVLAKDTQVLADLGAGISHDARTEQKGSILFAGDKPISSYLNLVRKSLDKPALSGGDALRKKDIDIFSARSKLFDGSTDIEFGDVVQDGVNYDDILFQFNTKLEKNKYQSTNYIDYQIRSFSNLHQEETVNPVTNLMLEANGSELLSSYKSLSAYSKHSFKLGARSELVTYLSIDSQDKETGEFGDSRFLNDTISYSSLLKENKQNFVWYNQYDFEVENKIKVSLETDLSLDIKKTNTLFLSTDTLFDFSVKNEEGFVVDQQQEREALGIILNPIFDYLINKQHSFGVNGKYNYTNLEDDASVEEDVMNSDFYTNETRQIDSFEPGLHYHFNNDKTKILAEFGYANQRFKGTVDSRQNALVFLLRYNYKIKPKILWANVVSRSLKRFSNQELFTSVNFYDNRSFSRYTPVELPSFIQWDVSSVFRYLNTANAKIAIASFNYSQSSKSLAPLVTTFENAQLVQYVEADVSSRFRAVGFLRYPIGSSHMTANFSFIHSNSLVIKDTKSKKIVSVHKSILLKYALVLSDDTDVKLGISYMDRSQNFDSFQTRFTFFEPSVEVRQFIKPKFWFDVTYKPILRLNLKDQHVISASFTTKFLDEKLKIALRIEDLLNFNNPIFIQKSIDPFIIRKISSARVGGYALLSVTYQLQ